MQINFAPACFASGKNVCDIALHRSGYRQNIHCIAFFKVGGFLISHDHRKGAFARNLKILQFSAKHYLRNSPLQARIRNNYIVGTSMNASLTDDEKYQPRK